jgi:hypothetical protein
MEKKAKDLDDKVSEQEGECESLRKENQWLKGLVVGRTTGESVIRSNHGSTLTSPRSGFVSANQTPATVSRVQLLRMSTPQRKMSSISTS